MNDADAGRIIADALATAAAPCATSSFQADGVVLLHMLHEVCPSIPVLFLDTVHHFEETLAYRDQIVERLRLNLITLRAVDPCPGLWRTDTDRCCRRHKVEPLFAALEHHDVWFTALRRDQSPTRAHLEQVAPFTLPSGRVLRKISPLAGWTRQDVWSYARAQALPLHPLYELGYASIGCEPCTTLAIDEAHPRSGRWGGRKLECGIHVQPPGATCSTSTASSSARCRSMPGATGPTSWS